MGLVEAAVEIRDRSTDLAKGVGDHLKIPFLSLTLRVVCLRLNLLDDRARNPGGEERDEGDADHHFDSSDDLPDGAGRYDVAVADSRHGLQNPPEGDTEGRKAVSVEEADQNGTRDREPDERCGETQRDRAGGDHLADPALEWRTRYVCVLAHPSTNSTVGPAHLAASSRATTARRSFLGEWRPLSRAVGVMCRQRGTARLGRGVSLGPGLFGSRSH